MGGRIVSLDEIKGYPIEHVFQDVVRRQEILTVRLPDGTTITINPSPQLKPLPELEGSVPEGWKDAIYE